MWTPYFTLLFLTKASASAKNEACVLAACRSAVQSCGRSVWYTLAEGLPSYFIWVLYVIIAGGLLAGWPCLPCVPKHAWLVSLSARNLAPLPAWPLLPVHLAPTVAQASALLCKGQPTDCGGKGWHIAMHSAAAALHAAALLPCPHVQVTPADCARARQLQRSASTSTSVTPGSMKLAPGRWWSRVSVAPAWQSRLCCCCPP